jgi:hypothetical protein
MGFKGFVVCGKGWRGRAQTRGLGGAGRSCRLTPLHINWQFDSASDDVTNYCGVRWDYYEILQQDWLLRSALLQYNSLASTAHQVEYEHERNNPVDYQVQPLKKWTGFRLQSLRISYHVCLSIYLWLYSPFLGLGRFFSFLIFYPVGRTPWTGDQPVERPLPAHRTAQIQNKRTQTFMH